MGSKRSRQGIVYIVGAGPGDPGLITVKGLECIKEADTIVYDYLSNERFIGYARQGVEAIHVGKRGASHTKTQEEINRLLIDRCREGRVVVRLKGGDPFIFGRGGEEALALAEAGVPFEIVPGVSSTAAAPAYAGIPLTHRSYNSTVAIITGHEDPAKPASNIPWDRIAGIGTLVFIMTMKNLSHNVQRLIDSGRSPDTPVALVRWGTKPEQETIVGRLGNIVELAKERGFKPPVVVVIGDVVRLRERLNWFETKPLFGKRIMVTRTREQAGEFSQALHRHGAEPVEFPVIEVVPPDSWEPVDRAIEDIEGYDWLIFTSVNGVRFFMDRLYSLGHDIRDLKGLKVCAIGPRTAEEVRSLGIRIDLIPEEFRAEGLIDALGRDGIGGRRFLLPRALKAREILPEEIRRLGGSIDVVPVYKTVKPMQDRDRVIGLLESDEIDVVTFTSSSTVKNFVEIIGRDEIKSLLRGVVIASIGPITSKTAEGLGIHVDIEAEDYTIPGLIDAMVRYFSKNEDTTGRTNPVTVSVK